MNENTVKVNYPFPAVQDQFNLLNGAEWFSQLDLKSGYHQIPMRAADTHKTAFSILGEKYEYLRMPMGLKNSPFVFQRALQKILGHLDFVNIYLDDVLIFSKTQKKHLKHNNTVSEICKKENKAINFEKSRFMEEEVEYLGRLVSKDGIKPDILRVTKREQLKPPTTQKQICDF